MSTKENELIALFMGAEFLRRPDSFDPEKYHESYVFKGHPGNWRVENETKSHLTAPQLMYHTDWDWLMPVITKISTIQIPNAHNYHMVQMGCCLKFYWCDILSYPISSTSTKSLLEASYRTVIKFIKRIGEKSES